MFLLRLRNWLMKVSAMILAAEWNLSNKIRPYHVKIHSNWIVSQV
jgi:hypothetical protein